MHVTIFDRKKTKSQSLVVLHAHIPEICGWLSLQAKRLFAMIDDQILEAGETVLGLVTAAGALRRAVAGQQRC